MQTEIPPVLAPSERAPDVEPLLPTPAARRTSAPAPGPLSRRIRFGWVLELFGMVGVALLHDELRKWVMGERAESLRFAKQLTRVQEFFGINWELSIQQFFLGWTPIVVALNCYYSTAHFLVPIFAAVYLYVKAPARYVRWRNTFLVMLLLTGPLGWFSYPITPPKYMPQSYGFVDTQVEFYNFAPQAPLRYGPDGEPAEDVVASDGNLYSGMPSHHVSWAIVAVLALWPVVRRRWAKGLLVAHLGITSLAVIVTANHRFLDFAGSVAEVALAYGVAGAIAWAFARRRARHRARSPEPPPVPVTT